MNNEITEELEIESLINIVLEGFEKVITEASETVDPNYDEKKIVDEINIKALEILRQYALFEGGTEKNSVFHALSDMQKLSPVTFGHSIVTAYMAIELLSRIGKVSKTEDLKKYWNLYEAYLMHDIGKLDPSVINFVNDPGTSEEIRKQIQKHAYPLVIRQKMDFYGIKSELVLKIAVTHHLRPDGKGYPKKEIDMVEDIYTEIATLADTIESIMHNNVTNRPYKVSKTFEVLKEILVEISGRQIESNVCAIGIDYISELIVRKNLKEEALVIQPEILSVS